MVKRRSEAGQTLIFVTVGLATIIAAAGLAVDMGYLRYEKRLMQAAADSAALVAATDKNLGESGMEDTDALDVAQANGFQNGVNNTTVAVTDSVVTPSDAIQVKVQQVLPSFFMNIWGIGTSTVYATATATIGTSNGCIYALNAAGLTVNVGAAINAPNCGVVDNGTLNGNGDITAASVGVYGSSAGYGGTVTSTAGEAIVQPAADPLAYLTPPTPAAICTGPLTITTTVTVPEGTYCGITVSSGGNATFSGLYMLTGSGGLQITGTGIAQVASGEGVTFYNTGTGTITFNGTGSIKLSAPDSAQVAGDGTFGSLPSGLLFYQNASDTAAADVSEGGTGNVILSGALYFPGASLTIAGSATGTNALVVASSVTVSGSGNLDADSTSIPTGAPLRTVTLAE
jgi:hypothetical protein